jgi:hypothetical protein
MPVVGKLGHVGIVVAHVGVAGLVQRRGHTHDGYVAVGQKAVAGGGGEGGGWRMVNGEWVNW